MIQDLLRGFVPADLVEAFDFDSLEQLPTQHVGDDRRQSRGDMLWRVRYRDRATGEDEWLYLLVLLEFRSMVDRHSRTGAAGFDRRRRGGENAARAGRCRPSAGEGP